jgi:anaerobic ribonucleoside-triphosphate reductase activating protein
VSKINLANWIECTEVEGPGKRFALWTQGCERHCIDCCNPQFFDFIPKTIIDSKEVCKLIGKSLNENKIEGVTFLGGEPVLQAKGLSEIAKFCKENNLSVMLFTGYVLENLLTETLPFVNELLQWTDLLVDGHFDTNNRETTRNWVGSTNQRFHFLTDRYTNGIEYDEQFSHGFELRIRPDGTFQLNGFPLNSL